MFRIVSLALSVLLMLVSPAMAHAAGADGPATKEESFTGVLHQRMAIGGETTGWGLTCANADGTSRVLDVDPAKIAKEIEAFDGKRVTITGTMGERRWAERGKVPVLMATGIVQAK